MPTTCGTVTFGSWPDSCVGEDSAVQVRFGKVFDNTPRVAAQIASIDAASHRDRRINVWVSDETIEGFRLHARTWEDSELYSVKVSWIATSESKVVQLGNLPIGNWPNRLSEAETRSIDFAMPFECAPEVAIGLSALDAQGTEHLRIWSEHSCVNSRDCQLQCGSWHTSVTWGVNLSWIASTSPGAAQLGSVKLGSWPSQSIESGRNQFCDVRFSHAFDEPPNVALALAGIDADSSKHTRLDTWADEIKKDGFRLHVKSWADSVIWSVKVSWIATPAFPDSTSFQIPPHHPPHGYIVVGPPLGHGWWGVTHKAKYNGQMYAVKTCRHPFKQHEQLLRKELQNLSQLPLHQNLLRYDGFILAADRLHIITEYMDAFKLTDLIPGPDGSYHPGHTLASVFTWTAQLFDGLARMHEASMYHRDLHGDNILVAKDIDGMPKKGGGALRIIDFGASGFNETGSPRMMSQEAGCWQYYSPERRTCQAFDDRDDVWAGGCQYVQLLSGKMICKRDGCGFEGIDFATSHTQICQAIQDVPSGQGRQLAEAILVMDRDCRPRAAAVRDLVQKMLQAPPGKRRCSGPSGDGRGCLRTPRSTRRRLRGSCNDE